jgi:hypothetical protein
MRKTPRVLIISWALLTHIGYAAPNTCDWLINKAKNKPSLIFDNYNDSPQNLDQVLSFIRKTFPQFLRSEQPGPMFFAPGGKAGDTMIDQISAAMADYHKHQAVLTKETEQRASLTTPGYELLPANQRSIIEAWIKRVEMIDSELAVDLEKSLALKSPNSAQWKQLTEVLSKHSSPLLDISLVATITSNRRSSAYFYLQNALNNDIGSFNRPTSVQEDRFIRSVKDLSDSERPMVLDWLRMLELYNAKKYQAVLDLASTLPNDHPRWQHILPTIRKSMTGDSDYWKYEKPADQFTESAFWGGNAKNRAHFKRPTTDFEKQKLDNMLRRNEMWHSQKSRQGKAPENWDLIADEAILMFIRRVEDMSPETYTRVLNIVGEWPPADARWQSLNQRLNRLTAENTDDFDLAQDIITNDL